MQTIQAIVFSHRSPFHQCVAQGGSLTISVYSFFLSLLPIEVYQRRQRREQPE